MSLKKNPMPTQAPDVRNKNFKEVYNIINVSDLEKFKENSVINIEFLQEKNIISKVAPYGLKVLGNGNITKPFTVQAKKFSENAIQKIVNAGGKIEVL